MPKRVATQYSQNPFLIEDSTCNSSFLRATCGIKIVDWETEQDRADFVPPPVFKLEYARFGDAVKEQLKRRGYREPTPIQTQGRPLLMQGTWSALPRRAVARRSATVLSFASKSHRRLGKGGGLSRRVHSCSRGDEGLERVKCDILCASPANWGTSSYDL